MRSQLLHGGIFSDKKRQSKHDENKMIAASMSSGSGTKLRSPRRSRKTHSISMEDKVKSWLSEAQEFVDKYKLSEAEQCFWQVRSVRL